MRMWFYVYFIFSGAVFLLGCSENIVYNNNVDQQQRISRNATVKSRRNIKVDNFSVSTVESDIFAGVNRIRKKYHRKNLIRDGKLDRVARAYSQKLAGWEKVVHQEPSGRRMEDRLEEAGIIDWRQAGENLAYSSAGAEPVQSALWGWQESPEHMENMLVPGYVYTGVGGYRDRKGDFYVTQLFLTPEN